MVSSVSSSSKFAWLLLVVITTSTVSAADIKAICSKTRNPTFCLKVLNSIPGAAKADLKTLATTVTTTASANATGTVNLIKSLLGKATDPQLKKKLSSCSGSVKDAIDNFQEAQADFAIGDFKGASFQVSAALTNVDDCNETIGSAVPSLPTKINNVESFCSIILAICTLG